MATKPKTPAPDAPTINVSAAVQAATMYKETVAALTNRRAGLIDEKRELEERNATLWHLPLRREEVLRFAQRGIDQLAAEYPASINWQKLFGALMQPKGQRDVRPSSSSSRTVGAHDGAVNLADVDRVDNTAGQSGGTAAHGLRGLLGLEDFGLLGKGSAVDLERALCFVMGDKLKQLIESRFRNTEYRAHSEELPTIENRREEIETNASRIETINTELAAVEAQLAELAPHSSGMRA